MPVSLKALLVFASVVALYVADQRFMGLPLWILVVLLAGTAWITWFRVERPIDIRRANGLCLRCGYNLTGNVSGVCPECGGGTMKWIYLTLLIVLLPLVLIQIGALVGVAIGLWGASFQTIAESVIWTAALSALCAGAAFRWRSLTHRRTLRGFPVDPVRPPP